MECSSLSLPLPQDQLKLVIDSIVWAFRHTERNIADTGAGCGVGGAGWGGGAVQGNGWRWYCYTVPHLTPSCLFDHYRIVSLCCRHPAGLNLLQELLVMFGNSDVATQFHQRFYTQLVQEIFAVMTGGWVGGWVGGCYCAAAAGRLGHCVAAPLPCLSRTPHPAPDRLTSPDRPHLTTADTFHKPGFKLQARILHHLFAIVQVCACGQPGRQTGRQGCALGVELMGLTPPAVSLTAAPTISSSAVPVSLPAASDGGHQSAVVGCGDDGGGRGRLPLQRRLCAAVRHHPAGHVLPQPAAPASAGACTCMLVVH